MKFKTKGVIGVGQWIKWLYYMDLVVVLLLALYSGIISKTATRREKVFTTLIMAWGIVGFFIFDFEFNDKFYALPRTLALTLFACMISMIFARNSSRKKVQWLLILGAVTIFSFLVVGIVGGPGIKVYSRDEVTKTLNLIRCCDLTIADTSIPDGMEDDDYIFQVDDMLYCYVDGNKPTRQGISVKNDVRIMLSGEETPSIKWHVKKSYYKTLEWGEEVEKEAPILLAESPQPYVEIFVPKESWRVKSSLRVTGD